MASSNLPAIRACLFDMDGLLIDSEDIYTLCTNIVLREFGKPDLPWNIKAQLQGRPGPEAGKIFQKWADLPIPREEFMDKTKALHAEHFPKTKPLPGVPELLRTLDATKNPHVEIALATSSHAANYELKTAHMKQMFEVFPESQRIKGDDPRIPQGRGKPAPDIYLLALKTINDRLMKDGGKEIYPEECLVFEDSVPGVEAGRRAGMQVVWCPHEGLLNEYKRREKEVLAGLTGEHKGDEGEKIASNVLSQTRQHARTPGQPGEIDDGWAVLFKSLVDFPYARFGINV